MGSTVQSRQAQFRVKVGQCPNLLLAFGVPATFQEPSWASPGSFTGCGRNPGGRSPPGRATQGAPGRAAPCGPEPPHVDPCEPGGPHWDGPVVWTKLKRVPIQGECSAEVDACVDPAKCRPVHFQGRTNVIMPKFTCCTATSFLLLPVTSGPENIPGSDRNLYERPTSGVRCFAADGVAADLLWFSGCRRRAWVSGPLPAGSPRSRPAPPPDGRPRSMPGPSDGSG